MVSHIFICCVEVVDFFFVDTTPFQDKYFSNEEDHTYDWRGVLPRKKYLSNLLKVNRLKIYALADKIVKIIHAKF